MDGKYRINFIKIHILECQLHRPDIIMVFNLFSIGTCNFLLEQLKKSNKNEIKYNLKTLEIMNTYKIWQYHVMFRYLFFITQIIMYINYVTNYN